MTKIAMTDGHWEDDQCERQPVGDFLYKLIDRRFARAQAAEDSKALCVALDADWGAGKSFFVSRWSKDVEAQGHLVVRFDAWQNDLSEDPLIAFLSQLNSGIGPWIKKLPVGTQVKRATTKKFQQVLKQGAKAVVPTLGALGKGALRRYVPGAVEELGEIFAGGPTPATSKDETDEALLGDATEKFFSAALQAQSDRQSAVTGLKEAIAALLTYLDSQQQTRLPMFVFIDELDRCRPDYAVRLLEGVKHLFDAPNVCFVFSTNMNQLAASMQAIYGPNFDAARYLKRFFSFEYLLPTAKPDGLALQLALDSDIVARRLPVFSGLPPKAVREANQNSVNIPLAADNVANSFAAVARAFDLSLRSQKQVFAYADAASMNLEAPTDTPRWELHTLYLFFLAALLHQAGASVFDEFIAGGPERLQTLQKIGVRGDVAYRGRDTSGDEVKKKLANASLFIKYSELAHKTRRVVAKNLQSNEFPDSIGSRLVGDHGPHDDRVSIHNYAALIRTAGGIRSGE